MADVLGPIEGGPTHVARRSLVSGASGGAGDAGAATKRTVTAETPLALHFKIPVIGKFGDIVKVDFTLPIGRDEAELLHVELGELLGRTA